jgi:DNA-binding NarL/FixJ family response regulator
MYATYEPEAVSMSTVGVVLYVAEPLVRDVLERAIEATDDLRLLSSVDRVADLDRVVRAVEDDVVVLAWTGADPAGFIERLGAAGVTDRCGVLLVAPATTEALVDAAVDAGVSGYLTTDSGPDELLDGLRSTAAGHAPYSPAATRWLVAAARRQMTTGSLTSREQEVVHLLADGLLNKQIARQLGISESTVKVHLGRVYQRLGVENRASAAMWARASGYGSRGTIGSR